MIIKKFSKMLGLCSFISLLNNSCNVEEKLPALGSQLAGAVDIANSQTDDVFYVLNSDYERRYDKGSILIVDPNATAGNEKIASLKTPRMGRSLSVQQNLLLVTYADPEARALGTVEIWDVANARAPTLLQSVTINCQPLNGIISPTQPYFAIDCIGGNLYMGKNPRATADAPFTMDLVRSYGYEHRALYFYETSGKTFLLGFPTDIDAPEFYDATLDDLVSYVSDTDPLAAVPNGVPDAFESTAAQRRRWGYAVPYQMFIYPVTDEELASKTEQVPGVPNAYGNFRYFDRGSYTKPTAVNTELHYIYYNLVEADGQPAGSNGAVDVGEFITTPNKHRYRTNFWAAKPGVDGNASTFYLSQRGDYGSQSNNVMKIAINDAALLNHTTSNFEQMFTATRAFGFAIDRDNSGRYPGDFAVASIGGQSMLLINSFRDLIYFSNAPFYSITRKFLDGPVAAQEAPSSRDGNGYGESFYQVGVSKSGKVLTSSFYGNALYLFDASPGISIKDQTPLRIQ